MAEDVKGCEAWLHSRNESDAGGVVQAEVEELLWVLLSAVVTRATDT
ncbi:MAG: hypothetical protein ABW157_22250 [Candidatus Thiodiazotropha sp. LLP2]